MTLITIAILNQKIPQAIVADEPETLGYKKRLSVVRTSVVIL
jgi:hypothetical protein